MCQHKKMDRNIVNEQNKTEKLLRFCTFEEWKTQKK